MDGITPVTAPPPRRPWWKRKRTWAAGAVWMAAVPVLYALSMGPAVYCVGRGWLPADTVLGAYAPAAWAAQLGGASPLLNRYSQWCYERGSVDAR